MKYCPKCNDTWSSDLNFCPFDGSVLSTGQQGTVALYDPRIGLLLDGRYRVMTPAGNDIFSEHYTATHVTLGKKYRVKFLRSSLLESSRYRSIFLDLARVRSKFNHPGIEKTVDYGIIENRLPYIITEYVEGQTLTDFLKTRTLTSSAAKDLFLKILDIMEYVHSAGYLIQNIHPSNIHIISSVGSDPQPVFGDVGMIRTNIMNPRGKISFIGIPEFLPPEIIMGNEPSKENDFYQAGLLVYYLFSGKPPSYGKNLDDALMMDKRRQLASSFPETVAPEIKNLIRQLLEVNPEKRLCDFEKIRNILSPPKPKKSVPHIFYILPVVLAFSVIAGYVIFRKKNEKQVPTAPEKPPAQPTVIIKPEVTSTKEPVKRTDFVVKIETVPTEATIQTPDNKYISPAVIHVKPGTQLKIKIVLKNYQDKEIILLPTSDEKLIIHLKPEEKNNGRKINPEKPVMKPVKGNTDELLDPFKKN